MGAYGNRRHVRAGFPQQAGLEAQRRASGISQFKIDPLDDAYVDQGGWIDDRFFLQGIVEIVAFAVNDVLAAVQEIGVRHEMKAAPSGFCTNGRRKEKEKKK